MIISEVPWRPEAFCWLPEGLRTIAIRFTLTLPYNAANSQLCGTSEKPFRKKSGASDLTGYVLGPPVCSTLHAVSVTLEKSGATSSCLGSGRSRPVSALERRELTHEQVCACSVS